MALIKELDWVVVTAVSFLVLLSLAALYPFSILNENSFFVRQLAFFLAGLLFLFSLAFVNISFFKKHRVAIFVLYLVGIFLLILLLFVGRDIRGAASWLPFVSRWIQFQPSEIVKIILIFILARYFTFQHIHLYKPLNVIISGAYAAIPAGLTLLQPDLGSAAVIFFLWLGIVILSGLRWRHFAIIMLLIIIGAGLMWTYGLEGYQKTRILAFLNPESDPLGANYSRNQSLIAIGVGGIWGKGFGANLHALDGFLPEAHTDFMFSMIVEATGLSGALIIFLLYGIIIWRLMTFEGKSNFDHLFASSLGLLILIQATLNIAIALGMLPVTGLTLPFLSYGGSSLISLFIGLGIYQALYVRS